MAHLPIAGTPGTAGTIIPPMSRSLRIWSIPESSSIDDRTQKHTHQISLYSHALIHNSKEAHVSWFRIIT